MSPVISAKVSEELKEAIEENTETDETRSEAVRRLLRDGLRDNDTPDPPITDPTTRLALQVAGSVGAVALIAWKGRQGFLMVATIIIVATVAALLRNLRKQGEQPPTPEDRTDETPREVTVDIGE